MKRAPVRDILWLFLVTRLLLVLVTYFGYILLTADKYSGAPVAPATFLSFWDHWDAERYLSIAQYGYKTSFDFAFFPLFPLLTTIIATPLGSWSYPLVGLLLSNGALLGTLFVLYQIAVDSGGEEVARRTLLYLCIFPTAFFFFAAYNESLFLLLVAAAFLAMRKQRWWLAGLFGCLATLTRSAGLLLIVPYLYELWLAREKALVRWRPLIAGITPLLLLPLGTLIYSIYAWKITGNPLVFATVQDHWARQLSWPWVGLTQVFFELFLNQPFGSFNEVHILLDFSATLGFIILIALGWRKIRVSYSLWAILLMIYIILTPSVGQRDPLISNQRFVLEMFPAFITLAMLSLKRPRLHQALLLLFPVLLATLSLLFVMNLWMV